MSDSPAERGFPKPDRPSDWHVEQHALVDGREEPAGATATPVIPPPARARRRRQALAILGVIVLTVVGAGLRRELFRGSNSKSVRDTTDACTRAYEAIQQWEAGRLSLQRLAVTLQAAGIAMTGGDVKSIQLAGEVLTMASEAAGAEPLDRSDLAAVDSSCAPAKATTGSP